MFDNLSNRLSAAIKNFSGKGKLTDKNMESMLQEVRTALLEADVNYKIVKDFLEKVKEKSLGEDVITSVSPSDMVVKIVHDQLVELLGEDTGIQFKLNGITSIMFVGLQGTGKTTSVGKVANVLKRKQNRNPLIIAADIIRPAAIKQLQILGDSIGVEVFTLGENTPAIEAVKQGMQYAKDKGYDTVLIDTAGRLHIDEELMGELSVIKQEVKPDEILLTVDAMTGQDIITVSKSFHDLLAVTGLVITKLDGDSRGGSVLSVRAITQVPIKFVGVGEKVDDLDVFYPSRLADRILGMGDILSLVEKAQDKMDMDAAEKSAKRMMEGVFTLDDMLAQFEQVSKMGSMKGLLKMIPGINQYADELNDDDVAKEMKKNKAIIQSMTKEEREDPSLLRASRKNRIASGSGCTVKDVTKLVTQYEKMKTQMKMMGRLTKGVGFSDLFK